MAQVVLSEVGLVLQECLGLSTGMSAAHLESSSKVA